MHTYDKNGDDAARQLKIFFNNREDSQQVENIYIYIYDSSNDTRHFFHVTCMKWQMHIYTDIQKPEVTLLVQTSTSHKCAWNLIFSVNTSFYFIYQGAMNLWWFLLYINCLLFFFFFDCFSWIFACLRLGSSWLQLLNIQS